MPCQGRSSNKGSSRNPISAKSHSRKLRGGRAKRAGAATPRPVVGDALLRLPRSGAVALWRERVSAVDAAATLAAARTTTATANV